MADGRNDELVSTTDCLEAVSVFKGWKNAFFIIALVCLIVLQICFWTVDTRNVVDPNSIPSPQKADELRVIATTAPQVFTLAAPVQVQETAVSAPNSPAAVTPPAAEANAPAAVTPPAPHREIYQVLNLRFEHVAWIIRITNFILIISVLLYALSLLLSLKISLIGRLGGINHITRAMFLAMLLLVLVLPWQRYFGPLVSGWTFTPGQLLAAKAQISEHGTIPNLAMYYARYCGLWILVVTVLVLAQMRSIRWAKATMRRLGVL